MKSILNSRKHQFANLLISQFANYSIRKFPVLIVFILTTICMVSTNSFSQEIQWQNTIGGSSYDALTVVRQTADGGFIMGGWSESGASIDKTENQIGNTDYWIVKTDENGNIIWQNTIGGVGSDNLMGIEQTDDSGFFIAGFSSSSISVDKTLPSYGSADYWIVKTDANGIIQWQSAFGGSADDHLYTICQNEGGLVLGGWSNSDSSGVKTENSLGGYDFWIVNMDSSGNIVWEQTIGGSGDEYLYSIERTSDGGFILGGFSNSNISGDKSENSKGDWDYWLVKINKFGIIQWQHTIGGTNSDKLTSVRETNDHGYILAGNSQSGVSGDKSISSFGGNDLWIIKTDSLGSLIWQQGFGGNVDEYLIDVFELPTESFLIGGYSYSGLSGNKSEASIGNNDFWFLKLDTNGKLLWQNSIGGNFNDYLYDLNLTSDGGFIAGGRSGSLISGDKTETVYGSSDFWAMKISGDPNLITGELFADLNGNGVKDPGEKPIASRKVEELSTGNFAFTDIDGFYSVMVLDTGSYTVSPPLITWWFPNPGIHTATFSSLYSLDSLNDFSFKPFGTYHDVCVKITPLSQFRSGFNASYQINYGNYGTTTIAPTVYFFPDSDVTFLSSSVTPSQITPDSVAWSLPALAPFQFGSIVVTVFVNTGLPIGTMINSTTHIEPYLTDDNPSCNNSNWEVYTTGSFDPNDIIVNRSDFTTTELSASPWLEYIIRFQNTGNDTAFTVKILNPIDTNKLDISSIEFVNASHPVNINWINYQRNMEFKFENILLPDSNTNEPFSHGFVRYRIQPKTTLNAGDIIPNFAAIYFDFNDPVITNTATTIIVLPTGLANSSPTPGKLLVFPNPAENSISISGIQLENGKAQLRLMDIYGKLILEKTISETSANLETNQLAKGVYLIQSGGSRATFVKQ